MSAFVRAFNGVSRRALLTSQLRLQLRSYASFPPYTIIDMPALSPTMTQGNLNAWTKKVGDVLAPGEVIAEVETDKAQMDFEFQEDGYLAQILVPEGTKDVPVGKPIAIYVEDEGDVAAFKDFTAADVKGDAAAPAAKEEAPAPSEAAKPADATASAATTTAKAAPAKSEGSAVSTRVMATPLAKTLALENGIALKGVKGSGPHGRIVKSDVEALIKKKSSAPASAKSTATSAAQAAAAAPMASYVDEEITSMRRIIADRLLASTSSTPSYIVSSDMSVAKLLKLRKALNESSDGEYKLSINDILVKAITVAARKVPDANAYWMPEQNVIRKFNNVDISVAVATPTGLITPIVKNAESKGLVAISNEIKDLVKRAKINKLAPQEFQGGTICISNLGMNHAVSMFTSIINPPQSAILAVSTIRRVAVEDASAENGFSFDSQMTITGTFDHRVIDGAKAGDFMRELKKVVENPLELLL